jgi:hypothetical protein
MRSRGSGETPPRWNHSRSSLLIAPGILTQAGMISCPRPFLGGYAESQAWRLKMSGSTDSRNSADQLRQPPRAAMF